MFDMYGVCIVRTYYYMMWTCTTWVQRRTRRFGDTSARFTVWYVRTYHTHLPGSYRSRSNVVDVRWNPDIPLEFARVGFCIHFCFLLVSVGHYDAFVGYRVVIDRVCTCTLAPLQHHLRPLLINTRLCLGRLSFTNSAECRSCCRPLREVLTPVVADCLT